MKPIVAKQYTNSNTTQSGVSSNMHNPRTYCKNGTSLSIQAGQYFYSKPRRDTGPWTHFEVGYIKDNSGIILYPECFTQFGYCVDNEVAAYVPADIINQFIYDNGGPADYNLLPKDVYTFRNQIEIMGNDLKNEE